MHIFTHSACLKHNPGPIAGFAPARLQTIIEALKADKYDNIKWIEALEPEESLVTPAQAGVPFSFSNKSNIREALSLLHTPAYIDDVLSPIEEGKERFFDKDTRAMSGTAEAALAAAATALAAATEVASGKIDKAFCLVSPGGHHAEADAAIGFCFFNHIALAAVAAQKRMNIGKVAVLDFDAHHGNGTQSFFWNFEDRLYISLHEESPLSGFANETGAWNNILNLPLPEGGDGNAFRKAFDEHAAPKLDNFRPDILFVSAGFDMHKHDPLATLCLNENDYLWLGRRLRDLSSALCQGRLVAVLEGGYNRKALAASAAAFVEGLM